ncbi:MAG: hypothetical protein K8R90_01710 [Candidatus Cloacimonetes bacterium]|nr:hypothetical protein [Candidatus Cloacimonadota bacterium]
MTRIALTAVLALLLTSLSAALPTSRSMQYGNSFLQRSDGVHALYWNPANIGNGNLRHGDFVALNLGYRLDNNFLTISEYNDMTGTVLSTADEDDLLNDAPALLCFSGEGHSQFIGWSQDNMAICISTHAYGKSAFQREYLELMFRGNEYNHAYTFDNPHNMFEAFTFADITYGVGGYSVNDWLPGISWLPETSFGYAASILVGIASVESSRFYGSLETTEDGLSLNQTIDMRLGLGGYGFKGLAGVSSQIDDNLSVGLTLDNILGLISWQGKSQKRRYTVIADSILLADIDDTVINEKRVKLDNDGFISMLPVTLNLGALYAWRNTSYSLDWQHRVNESPIGNAKPTLSMAAEYLPIEQLPLRLGWSGNRDRKGRLNVSLGYRNPKYEIDISVCPDGIFPSGEDMSLGWALDWRLKY